ncbi:MAG: hypothetical protein ACI9ES_003049 [Oceanospirillaceae bacterium]|jgi:hypothetical protein
MLLLIIALFLMWLALREWNNSRSSIDGFNTPSKVYFGICFSLALMAAWTPLKKMYFESFLSDKASILADGKPAQVHCNTAFDAMFDSSINVIGHANPRTGDIVFQLSWCDKLMDYLANPHQVDTTKRYSLMLFTHEVMHIRGELNEQKTECQAIQRNHIAGELLGISKATALDHTREYFEREYPRHPYFSDKCGPGKAYDEGLTGAIW